jgi:hypothetical protein
MLISTALLLDSIIRNSVCTPAKLPCRRVEVGYEKNKYISYRKHPSTGNNVLRARYIQLDYKLISHNNDLNSLKTTVGILQRQELFSDSQSECHTL